MRRSVPRPALTGSVAPGPVGGSCLSVLGAASGSGWQNGCSEGGMRRLRGPCSRRPRRPAHLRRALRPAAPRAGVGRDGGERRRDDHGREGHGARRGGLRRADAAIDAGAAGARSRPLRHHRAEHLAQRPAGLPVRRARRASPSATTATSRTPPSWPATQACCPGIVDDARTKSDSDLVAHLVARRFPPEIFESGTLRPDDGTTTWSKP